MPADADPSRYRQQVALPVLGEAGQSRLAESHVLVVGCGALGCTGLDLLCRAGVGRLTFIDRDIVEASNLHRQVLFTQADADSAEPKAIAAARRLAAINPDVGLDPHVADLHDDSAHTLLHSDSPPSIYVDATDNFETRRTLNRVAVATSRPMVYAGIIGTVGTVMLIHPGRSPCLACVLPDDASSGETCETAGVLGPAVGVVASLQAAMTIRVLTGDLDHAGFLTEMDAWTGITRQIDLRDAKLPDCPVCGSGTSTRTRPPRQPSARVVCGRDAVQVSPDTDGHADLQAIATQLKPLADVRPTEHAIYAAIHGIPESLVVFADGRVLVRGTADPARARTLVARYLGG